MLPVLLLATAAAVAAAAATSHETRCPGEEPYVGGKIAALCAERFVDPGSPDYTRWIVHFYGRECRRCRELAPVVRAAAGLGDQAGDGVRYGAVDCHDERNKRFCKDQGVWKLPALRVLARKEAYAGAYDPEELRAWASRFAGAASPLAAAASLNQRQRSGGKSGAPALCPAYELYDEPRMAREFLRAHNVYRCVAGLPLLRWDGKLFATARRWALRAPPDKLMHSPEDDRRSKSGAVYGENVAVGDGLQPGIVVARWYGEIRGTEGGRGGAPRPHRSGLGHYTQIVWRRTRKLGCALAQNGHVAVCHYDPAGNEKGHHLTQVAPPMPGYNGPDGELRCGGPVESITVSRSRGYGQHES